MVECQGQSLSLTTTVFLLAYTHYASEGQSHNANAARFSSDQGKTKGEGFILVPAPVAKGSGRSVRGMRL